MGNTSLRELQTGLWHWHAPHPDWTQGEPWDKNVSSYAVDNGKHLILFDPLAVPPEIEAYAAKRETVIVLTCPWHERDSESLVERLNIPVYTPFRDNADDLMRKFGISREEAGHGSPDLIWLLIENKGVAHPFQPGDTLPFGIKVFSGQWPNDTVLWIESHQAVICGDTLVDFGQGLEINLRWRGDKDAHQKIVESLQPLLQLPIQHMLATHGGPMDAATLKRVLLDPSS